MPWIIFAVPLQRGQGAASWRPVPAHSGQMFSPVPVVPGGASSPGLITMSVGFYVGAFRFSVVISGFSPEPADVIKVRMCRV
jgi:hypothetical protein